jgi:hypothetical protein
MISKVCGSVVGSNVSDDGVDNDSYDVVNGNVNEDIDNAVWFHGASPPNQ